VLRKIQAAVVVGQVALVKARLSPGPALFLLNHKKGFLAKLEQDYHVQILILADGRMGPEEYEFQMETAKAQLIATVSDSSQSAASDKPSAEAANEDESADTATEEGREPLTVVDEEEEPAPRPPAAEQTAEEPEPENATEPEQSKGE
jgi:hypothetical protein